LLADASGAAFEQLLVGARSSGRAGEIRLRLADGATAVELSATPFRAEHQLLLLVRARPAATTQGQRLLAELVERSPDAVAVTDGAGRVLVANAAFRAMVPAAPGATPPAVEGEPIDALLGDTAGALRSLLEQARRGGLAQHARLALPRPDAPSLAVHAALLPEGEQERVGFTLSPLGAAPAVSLHQAHALAAAILGLGEQVGHQALPQLMRAATGLAERHLIETAWQRHGGDADATAAELMITRQSLDLRMQRLGLLPGPGGAPTPVR
jgi:hypothetical protein